MAHRGTFSTTGCPYAPGPGTGLRLRAAGRGRDARAVLLLPARYVGLWNDGTAAAAEARRVRRGLARRLRPVRGVHHRAALAAGGVLLALVCLRLAAAPAGAEECDRDFRARLHGPSRHHPARF